MELYLIRHGQTRMNREHRYSGRGDEPLDEVGVKKAQMLQKRVVSLEFDAAYVSPAKRAVQTAGIALGGRAFALEPALRELDFGRWEGMTFEQIQRSDPVLAADWMKDGASFVFPGGESMPVLEKRLRVFLEELLAFRMDQGVALVTHKGCVNMLLSLLLHGDASGFWRYDPPLGSLSHVSVYDGGASLRSMEGGWG